MRSRLKRLDPMRICRGLWSPRLTNSGKAVRGRMPGVRRALTLDATRTGAAQEPPESLGHLCCAWHRPVVGVLPPPEAHPMPVPFPHAWVPVCARPGRVVAGRLRPQPLPPGTRRDPSGLNREPLAGRVMPPRMKSFHRAAMLRLVYAIMADITRREAFRSGRAGGRPWPEPRPERAVSPWAFVSWTWCGIRRPAA